MAAHKQKSNISRYPVDSATRTCCRGIGDHTAECTLPPVDLDPPDPAIARWQELTERDIHIEHDGDAEKVLSFPRPAWAGPDCDQVGVNVSLTSYNSDSAYIPANHMGGEAIGETVMPCGFRVRGRLIGEGWVGVGITTTRYTSGEWRELGATLTLDEARNLVDVILAAIDMVGGEK